MRAGGGVLGVGGLPRPEGSPLGQLRPPAPNKNALSNFYSNNLIGGYYASRY